MHAEMANQTLNFAGADLEIRAALDDNKVTIDVMKSGACVHRLTIDDAVGRMEHSWIAALLRREDRVALSEMVADADDYVSGLNINQG